MKAGMSLAITSALRPSLACSNVMKRRVCSSVGLPSVDGLHPPVAVFRSSASISVIMIVCLLSFSDFRWAVSVSVLLVIVLNLVVVTRRVVVAVANLVVILAVPGLVIPVVVLVLVLCRVAGRIAASGCALQLVGGQVGAVEPKIG